MELTPPLTDQVPGMPLLHRRPKDEHLHIGKMSTIETTLSITVPQTQNNVKLRKDPIETPNISRRVH